MSKKFTLEGYISMSGSVAFRDDAIVYGIMCDNRPMVFYVKPDYYEFANFLDDMCGDYVSLKGDIDVSGDGLLELWATNVTKL